MVPEQTPYEVYRGKTVKVDRAGVQRSLVRAEQILGLTPAEYKFELVLLPVEEMQRMRTMGGANHITGKIVLPSESPEAVQLHEATHYVMGKRGLTFPGDPLRRRYWDRLIGETFAEGVAVKGFGYKKPYLNDSIGIVRRSDEERIARMEREAPTNAHALALVQTVCEKKVWDSKFDRGLLVQVIKNVGLEMEKFLRSEDPAIVRDVDEAITFVSMANATRLAFNRVPLKKLCAELEEAIKAGIGPAEFYLRNIVKYTHFERPSPYYEG